MNPQNGQTPLDYLNQIAPQEPKKTRLQFNFKTVIFGAIILVVLVIIMASVATAIGNSGKEPWQRLSARLTTTQEIADDATKKLKNSAIRSHNSNLKIYLTNIQRDVATPLGKLEIDPGKLPATVMKEEKATAMRERLEDARLNAKFDSAYAREMSYQLSTLLALYQQLYSSSSQEVTKTFLKKAYDDLLPTQKALADYSAANE